MPTRFASDLRSDAKDFKRDKKHTKKWVTGEMLKPGMMAEVPEPGKVRPKPHSSKLFAQREREGRRTVHSAATKRQQSVRAEIEDAMGEAHGIDTSSDEDVYDASTAPLPADFATFESASGPAAGRDVLSAALSKAVQRFEHLETEKLVTREWDVIDQSKLNEDISADEDAEFEFVDAHTL
jgi:hypothetical protein